MKNECSDNFQNEVIFKKNYSNIVREKLVKRNICKNVSLQKFIPYFFQYKMLFMHLNNCAYIHWHQKFEIIKIWSN